MSHDFFTAKGSYREVTKVSRQKSNFLNYLVVSVHTFTGLCAIAILLTSTEFQQQVSVHASNNHIFQFSCFVLMICLGLAWLMIPPSQSIAADMVEIAGKIAEPETLADGLKKEITEHLDYIIKTLNTHSETSRIFSNALETAGRKLVELTSPEQLRLAIGFLIAENNKMHKETHELQSNLTTSRIQIEDLKQNLEEAEQTGLRDSLTSLWNRRAFDKILDAQIQIAPNKNSPLSLILTDIDHFKKINDRFGHVVGDEVLRLVARTISKSIKSRDMAARFGGEEFAIILPDTELVNAMQIADQLRQVLESQKWVVHHRKESIGTITASFGVAEHKFGEKKSTFMNRTDQKLYDAKSSGRNRVAG